MGELELGLSYKPNDSINRAHIKRPPLYQSWKKEIQNIVSKTHFYQKQLNIVCCCTKDVTKMVKSTLFNKVSKSTHSNYGQIPNQKFQIRSG